MYGSPQTHTNAPDRAVSSAPRSKLSDTCPQGESESAIGLGLTTLENTLTHKLLRAVRKDGRSKCAGSLRRRRLSPLDSAPLAELRPVHGHRPGCHSPYLGLPGLGVCAAAGTSLHWLMMITANAHQLALLTQPVPDLRPVAHPTNTGSLSAILVTQKGRSSRLLRSPLSLQWCRDQDGVLEELSLNKIQRPRQNTHSLLLAVNSGSIVRKFVLLFNNG